jgi:hypothetical protein
MIFWGWALVAAGVYLAIGIVVLLIVTKFPADLSRRDRLAIVLLWLPLALRGSFFR